MLICFLFKDAECSAAMTSPDFQRFRIRHQVIHLLWSVFMSTLHQTYHKAPWWHVTSQNLVRGGNLPPESPISTCLLCKTIFCCWFSRHSWQTCPQHDFPLNEYASHEFYLTGVAAPCSCWFMVGTYQRFCSTCWSHVSHKYVSCLTILDTASNQKWIYKTGWHTKTGILKATSTCRVRQVLWLLVVYTHMPLKVENIQNQWLNYYGSFQPLWSHGEMWSQLVSKITFWRIVAP